MTSEQPAISRVLTTHAPIGMTLIACIAFAATAPVLAVEPIRAPTVAALPDCFDPGRDAVADLKIAIELASTQHKLILIDLGGDWCPGCLEVERFFEKNESFRRRRDDAFVFLRVNYSDANRNAALTKRLPWFFGYPHWFVLDETGRVVDSSFAQIGAGEFEAFLQKWTGASRPERGRTTP